MEHLTLLVSGQLPGLVRGLHPLVESHPRQAQHTQPPQLCQAPDISTKGFDKEYFQCITKYLYIDSFTKMKSYQRN